MVLLVLDRTRPDRLHTRLSSYHVATRYFPAIVGSVTVILWRAISRAYMRFMPYVLMASVPTTLDQTTKDRATRVMDALGVLAVYEFGPLATLALIREGHAASSFVQISAQFTGFLVAPLKASLLQTTRDSTGWAMNVADGIAAILIALYAMILISIIVIFVHLRQQKTGLKWDPASLAAQMALLRHLNYKEAFLGSEYCKVWEYRNLTCGLVRDHGVLRLGYWQHQKSNRIVHGIRFIGSGMGLFLTTSPVADIDKAETLEMQKVTRDRILALQICSMRFIDERPETAIHLCTLKMVSLVT